MCGIFGLWHRDGRPIVPAAVRDAVTSLRHRGPNDEGYLLVNTRTGHTLLCGGNDTRAELDLPHIDQIASCTSEPFNLALGFRRLAIVDLTHAGFQPMGDPKAGRWLVFNGEIYNYLELRAELRSVGYYFKTGTDTEVILAAYQRWGRSCVNRFNGMWAFALWNQAEHELLISRDRFGVKPLYTVCRGDTTFAFASEIKALLAGKVVPFSPSIRSVSRYVAFGRLPSHGQGETFVDGIQEFPVAHQAVISCNTQLRDRYWSLPRQTHGRCFRRQATCTDYSELFADAVRLQLRGDVPIGTCLSGGLDSSSIVAEVRRISAGRSGASLESLEPRQHTFSATYPIAGRWNEEDHIQRVIRHTGATAHFVQPTADSLWSSLEQLVWHQDEPFQSTSIFAQWCVMSLARRAGITVLLDGQGADELLGGYAPSGWFSRDLLTRGRFVAAIRELQQVRRADQNLGRAVAIGLVGHLPKSARIRLSHTRMRPSIKSSGSSARAYGRLMHPSARKDRIAELHSLHSLDEHLAYLMAEHLPDYCVTRIVTRWRSRSRVGSRFSTTAWLSLCSHVALICAFTRDGRNGCTVCLSRASSLMTLYGDATRWASKRRR